MRPNVTSCSSYVYGAVAQLVERIVRNDEVACSTHVRSTFFHWFNVLAHFDVRYEQFQRCELGYTAQSSFTT